MKLNEFDFRVWSDKNGYIEDFERRDIAVQEPYIEIRKLGKEIEFLATIRNGVIFSSFPIENGKIELYSGLKDKNGVKIYVGDILELRDGFESEIFVVRFELFKGIYMKAKSGIELMEDLYEEWKEFASVIGNIHENPELLKNIKG